jgi:hypothetical protein
MQKINDSGVGFRHISDVLDSVMLRIPPDESPPEQEESGAENALS